MAEVRRRAWNGSGQGGEEADVANDQIGVDHGSSPSRRRRSSAAVRPDTRTTLSRAPAPREIETDEGGTRKARPKRRTRLAFASPSAGGAVSLTTRAPARSPPRVSREDLGWTRTLRLAPPSTSPASR